MKQSALALVTVTGVAIISIADAPDWSIESYAGWLGAMAGTAFIGQINPRLGAAIGGLLLATIVLRKGEATLDKALSLMGQGRRTTGTARRLR